MLAVPGDREESDAISAGDREDREDTGEEDEGEIMLSGQGPGGD